MPVPTNLSDLSTTAASNSPAATDTLSTTDDYLRAHASILAKIGDGTNALTTPALGTPTSLTLTNATGLPPSTGLSAAVPYTKGGTGLTSLTALSVPVANTTAAITLLSATALQSLRVNAGGTAWEAFTPGTGDFSSNTATSVDGEIMLFSGTGGKTGKRATTTGLLKAASGVIGAAVSGTDIKTVNGTSLIGSGNISASGSLVYLATISPTAAANAESLSAFSASYDSYIIVGQGILPASDDSLVIRFANSGVVDTASNYSSATTNNTSYSTAAASISIAETVYSSGKGANFEIRVRNANDATNIKSIHVDSEHQTSSVPAWKNMFKGGVYFAASAISGIRFYWNGGANFAATGVIRIYGVSNS